MASESKDAYSFSFSLIFKLLQQRDARPSPFQVKYGVRRQFAFREGHDTELRRDTALKPPRTYTACPGDRLSKNTRSLRRCTAKNTGVITCKNSFRLLTIIPNYSIHIKSFIVSNGSIMGFIWANKSDTVKEEFDEDETRLYGIT